MKRKLIIRLGAAAAAVLVVAYAASPLLAARSLIQAAKAGDEKGLERQVDFPAFRASLKDELNARMMAEMRNDPRMADSGLSGLGMLLAPAIVGGAVDAFVTPQAISMMVQEGRTPKPAFSIAVTLTRDDQPDEAVSLLMKRRNLFGWKLAAIDLGAPD